MVVPDGDPSGEPVVAQSARPDPLARQATRGVWLLPVVGLLLLWATSEHQPDPSTEFESWSRFVTTDRFLASHLAGSIAGQALYLVACTALAVVVLGRSPRVRATVVGFVLSVLGSAGLLAGFGTAAFAQPAIGRLQLDGLAAKPVYDDVYDTPALVTLLGGALLFAVGGALLAWAAAAMPGAPRWAVVLFGASTPLIAVVGVAFGPAQTVGALALAAGGTGLAVWLARTSTGSVRAPVGVTQRMAPDGQAAR